MLSHGELWVQRIGGGQGVVEGYQSGAFYGVCSFLRDWDYFLQSVATMEDFELGSKIELWLGMDGLEGGNNYTKENQL